MLMAQSLLRHRLGADWRAPRDPDDLKRSREFCDLLRLFADHPGPRCLYSIHNMVQARLGIGSLLRVPVSLGNPWPASSHQHKPCICVLTQCLSNQPPTPNRWA